MFGIETASPGGFIALIAFGVGAALILGIVFGWFARLTPSRAKPPRRS